MSQTDPYAPPQASLAGLTLSEQAERDSGVLRYSTFWARVGASVIDLLVFMPLIVADIIFSGETRVFKLYMLVPIQLVCAYLYVYMVIKYGGSPGKLLAGLRIVNANGSPVTLKGAALRYAPFWLLGFATSVLEIVAVLSMADADYVGLGYLERAAAIDVQLPMFATVSMLPMIWVAACFVVMLTNEKRRTLHDFIAGTVVVRK